MRILETILLSALAVVRGMGITILISVIGFALGFIVGIPMAVARAYGNRTSRIFIQAYEGFFRGTPLIVTLFIFYFGLRYIGILIGNPDFQIALPPFLAAVLALGLTSSAYQSLIFRGAIQSISSDQYDAARSLGMGKWKAVFRVIFPQAFRVSIPSLANEFTIVLKDSPITYVVAIPEMLTEARGIIDSAMGKVFFEVLVPVSLLYFILFIFANKLFDALDRKLKIPGFDIAER